MITGMELLSYEERLKETELYSLGNRRLQCDLSEAFQYLKEAYKKNREKHFKGVYSEKTRMNSGLKSNYILIFNISYRKAILGVHVTLLTTS